MVQRLARSVRPCLQQLGSECVISRATWRISNCQRLSTPPSFSSATDASFAAGGLQAPIEYASPTKPPSARPVETRKSQLIRTYTSLLRTSPVILFFQHSSITAVEWAAVRRELNRAVTAVPASGPVGGLDLSTRVKLQVLRTNMFNVALKITEFFNPEAAGTMASTPRTSKGPVVHDLSQAAYDAVRKASIPAHSTYAQIEPVLVGPLAALILPAISPAHLAAALSVLAPVPAKFPAPTRRKCPGYHDATCQSGLAKLILVGGRIEGRIFDEAGVSWVAGINGGLDELRAQLVGVLHGAGLGLASTLEGGSRNIWLALEGRKKQLEGDKAQ